MEQEKDSTCIICGGQKAEGIFILSEFICEACELEMVRTDVKDAKYPFFIRQLKQIWFGKNA
ncbi:MULTISPECIES: sigma factor G inhibitor Gin [unclassified Paenibacillus]|uniref:sigma factor G inhibitor Gin n=1 Tax=unclassified Paenibacillus TaxID=185978 RepID=UPI001C122CC1|nr:MULTISPECIES: sigma factor G inhibitor Gin [unclassified Paenibacillus]MBU5444163.1 sigma factor G inhibitor Gin [Paenibacillus sp. MSJ-34]CAH0122700.1 Anti-sigma-G factor Gin [Paenibacillus sp. CECT 9249]